MPVASIDPARTARVSARITLVGRSDREARPQGSPGGRYVDTGSAEGAGTLRGARLPQPHQRSSRRPPCRCVDRADRQLQDTVGAADQRHEARPRAQAGMHRPHRPRAAVPGSGRPTNTASIGKRMNIMWMPFEPGSQSPAPAASAGRPISPMNLPHRPSATSRRSASTAERDTFRATSIAGARWPPSSGAASARCLAAPEPGPTELRSSSGSGR